MPTTTKRKNPKRVAAGRKAARTRARKYGKVTRRKAGTTKRSRRRGLSEFWSPAVARGSAMATASGFTGGAAAAIIDNLLDKTPKPPHDGWRVAAFLGGGFVLAALLRVPNMGAGVAAIGGYKLMKVTGLAEEDADNIKYAREIEQLPAMLDVHGQVMAENDLYLEEGDLYLEENDLYLEEGYQVPYAPDFGSPTGM